MQPTRLQDLQAHYSELTDMDKALAIRARKQTTTYLKGRTKIGFAVRSTIEPHPSTIDLAIQQAV